MQEVANQTLEINDKKILLKIGEKYFMDLQLDELKIKFTLLTASAKAKYDKKKKSLRIIIPVDQTVKYEPENVEPEAKEEELKENVIEDETWKNKVLDFSEPSVTVKTLDNQESQEQPTPKLVEQIDEEDVVDEVKQEPKPEVQEDEDI